MCCWRSTVMSTKVMVIKSQTSRSKCNIEYKVYELSYLVYIYIWSHRTAVLCLLKINSQTIYGLLLADKFMLKFLNFQRRICPPNLKWQTRSGSVKGQEADLKTNRYPCLSPTYNIEALYQSPTIENTVLCTESKNS